MAYIVLLILADYSEWKVVKLMIHFICSCWSDLNHDTPVTDLFIVPLASTWKTYQYFYRHVTASLCLKNTDEPSHNLACWVSTMEKGIHSCRLSKLTWNMIAVIKIDLNMGHLWLTRFIHDGNMVWFAHFGWVPSVLVTEMLMWAHSYEYTCNEQCSQKSAS